MTGRTKKATPSSQPIRDDWLARIAASRSAGVLLAAYALCTDSLTGWHAMDFAMRGLLDEPAHVATALIILGAIVRLRGTPPDPRFSWTMLACSVLIDVDHLPAEFGSYDLTSGTPRPYPHALWVVIVLILAWAIARYLAIRAARSRPATAELILSGAAWGITAHFARDIATAPMSFWWPVTDMPVQVPYWWYLAALTVLIVLGPIRRGGLQTGLARTAAGNDASTQKPDGTAAASALGPVQG